MGAIFSSPKVSAPPKAPEKTDAEIAAAAADNRRQAAYSQGRRSTILGGSIDNNSGGVKRLLGR